MVDGMIEIVALLVLPAGFVFYHLMTYGRRGRRWGKQ